MTDREEMQQLVSLIDRLERLLQRSGLSELEVASGGMTIVLRTPSALAPQATSMTLTPPVVGPPAPAVDEAPEERAAHAVVAPLTGVFYRSPSPGAEPYVREGGPVSSGQVIGLIEAMKLFNEIKSDVSGTIRRVAVGDGELVKARHVLIEVDPS